MTLRMQVLAACVAVAGLASSALAEAPAEPAAAAPAPEELSDDAIFTKLFASRDFCTKIDPANAAAYDKGLAALTADSVAETKAFQAKPDFSAIVAKGVAEFEEREKDPAMAGTGKGMCENFIKMQ